MEQGLLAKISGLAECSAAASGDGATGLRAGAGTPEFSRVKRYRCLAPILPPRHPFTGTPCAMGQVAWRLMSFCTATYSPRNDGILLDRGVVQRFAD